MSNGARYAALLVLAQVVTVTTVPAQQRAFEFRIPAGSLDAALKQYARITGQKVLYRSVTIRDRRSSGLSGRIDADSALEQLLDGSGLVAVRPSSGVIVIEVASQRMMAEPQRASLPDDIVVTGTNIRGGAVISDIRSISRQDIERSGRATVADVIAALPGNFGGAGNPVAALTGSDTSSINNTVAPAANLRGLGSDATLTLFDGRRIAGSGGRGDFTDLSAIPSLAVDRIEVLADGASAVYGSDAVGGVVNLLLRHRMDGVEMRLRGGTTTKGGVRSAILGAATGRDWQSGGFFLAYEYEHRDALAGAARRFTATADLRPFGGSDRRLYYSSPGTILSFDPLKGGFTPASRIPHLTAGTTPTLDQIQPGQNLYNQLAGFDLAPQIDRHALFGHIEQRLAEGLQIFAEARFVRRTFAYNSPASTTPFVVTAANPYFLPLDGLPFSLIGYSFYPELGAGRTEGRVSSFGFTGGVDWDVGRWAINAYAAFARENSRDRTDNIINTTALDEALGTIPDDPVTAFSPATQGYFNPYGSGTLNTRTILDFVGSGFAELERSSHILDMALKADGPVADLAGGAMRMAVGAAYRRESFRAGGRTFYSGNRPTDVATPRGARDIGSIFGEVTAPLIGSSNRVAGIHALTLSAAARHERYSDFGTTTNPRLGIAWMPAEGVTLRASWGTSFRAPALIEVNDRRTISPTQLPNDLGGYTPSIVVGGGNPNLGPERATTWSGGVTLEPRQMPGFQVGYTLFSTRFRDRIARPALQDTSRTLLDPALAGLVERVDPANDPAALARVEALLADPNAASAGGLPASSFQAIIDGRYVNTGRLSVAGMDVNANWSRVVGDSRWDAGMNATWLFYYDVQATPLSPVVDRLDTLANPTAIRVRGNLGWSRGGFSAALFGNWTNEYRNDGAAPYRSIASFFTVDANIGFAVARGALAGFRFALSAENLFDAAPPFVDRVTGIGFDAANASPFGRILSLELRRAF